MTRLHSLQNNNELLWPNIYSDVRGNDNTDAMLVTSQAVEIPNGWKKMLNRLNSLRCLSGNWDDEGSEAPNNDIITGAFLLLNKLNAMDYHPPSRIIPSPQGTIVIEWQIDDCYIEAEIESLHRAEWMKRTREGTISHWIMELPKRETGSETDYLMSKSKKAA